MSRAAQVAAITVAVLMSVPSIAFAREGTVPAASTVSVVVSLTGLLVAVLLLVQALAVRRVAFGGLLADKIGYVVLAVVCLSAAALVQWVGNFVTLVTQPQVQLASQALVISAMGLLAAYFYGVRSALQSYLNAMTGTEMLQSGPASTSEGERA